MLGSSYNTKTITKLKVLVHEFSSTVRNIFQYSSELMTIPPHLADRLQLSAWKNFERLVQETLTLGKE